jgi:hypothetical protein
VESLRELAPGVGVLKSALGESFAQGQPPLLFSLLRDEYDHQNPLHHHVEDQAVGFVDAGVLTPDDGHEWLLEDDVAGDIG